MNRYRNACRLLAAASVAILAGCKSDAPRTPPPDARRPVIKTEAELAAEREQMLGTGQVVAADTPQIEGADPEPSPSPTRRTPTPPVMPTPDAIQADILMVNNSAVTVAEVLYPLWERIEELRQTQTPANFRAQLQRMIRREVQREVGSLLVYAEAMAELGDERRGMVEAQVEKQISNVVAHDFGGSKARLEAHLAERGLTMDTLRQLTAREMVVSSYSREKLMAQIQVRRDDLLRYYRRNLSRYQTQEARELLLIEFPFEKFLADGQTWDQAPRPARAAAKLAALRQARAAHDALAERPFADVAREYSRGVYASEGGSWGMIGRPLQPPYDVPSRLIFEFEEGQHSEPLETDRGWCIVQCGKVQAASEASFTEVQDDIRRELMERRFAKLSMEYVLELAGNATISSLDAFVSAVAKRAEQGLPRTATAGSH
jgi:hypothetical protein